MKSHAVLEVDPSIIERNLLIADKSRSPSPVIGISQLLGNTSSEKKEDVDEVPCIHVRPAAGFCVKTHTVEGDKVFLNICHTPEIPAPKDISDEELIKILESDDAPSYTVPLSIGALHIEADKSGNVCSVYDVAINTEFFNKILTNQLFKTFFMTVVIEGVQNKFDIELTLKSDKPYVVLKNRKQIGEIASHRIQKRAPRQPPKPEPRKKLIEVISSTDEPSAATEPLESPKTAPISHPIGVVSAVSVDENNKLRLFAVAPKNGDALLLLALAKIKALSGSDVNLDVSSRRLIISCERNETIDCVLPYSVQPEKVVAEYFVNLQLMDVISGASHGSYSFIHDNYIYRINKFTHKRVYLSCRLIRCRGAGKGVKGATRGEVYGFKLSKPHNHPPEENKIKHFEVKEYVRDEARCTRDTSKEIYERAVKLFNCYELSRACVDGLVKRSRERTAIEASERPATSRNAVRKKVDTEDEELEELMLSQQDPEAKSLIALTANERDETDGSPAIAVSDSEVCERDDPEVCGEGNEGVIEVVVNEEGELPLEQHEVPVEYVEVDEGVDQDELLLQDPDEVIVEEAVSSGSESDGSYSPDESSYDSESLSEPQTRLTLPEKRFKGHDGRPLSFKFGRSPEERRQGVRTTNRSSYERSLKRRPPSDSEDCHPEKRLSIEESLMKIFSSTYFSSADNVFNLMSRPESIPNYDDDQNALSSANSLNIIKSASKLCTFTAVKASQMRNLLVGKTKELDVLENALLEHLSNLMCFSGMEFFQKCFGRTLQQAIELGKKGDRKCKSVWNEDEMYSKRETKNDCKQLAVALLCLSGKAYLALSELIDLPGSHVARKWATNSEGNPGFSAQPFAAIRSEMSAIRSKTLFVCLSVKDVELKKQVGSSCGRLFGYTDLGYGRIESDSVPEATRSVVFFASALNSHWKVPLGYCLADNLSPQVRANLLCQFVSKLEFNGIKCVGVVLDSSAVSTRVYEEFGVLSKDSLPLGAFHTNADEKIRVSPFVDTLEVMESVKQLLREKRNFYTSAGEIISWSHLEFVQRFVDSETSEWVLSPGTYTVDFMDSLKFLKIKIRKDPWPFERYCPALMNTLLEHGASIPKNFISTMKFVQNMVEITEIFTSCNRFHDKFRLTNDKNFLAAISKLIHYLEGLRFPSGRFVKDEDRRMPIMNLCMNLSSLKVVLRRVFCEKSEIFNRLTLANVKQFISEITSRDCLTPVQFRERYFESIQNLDISPAGNLISRRFLAEDSKKAPVDSTFFTYSTYVYSPMRSVCDRLSHFFVDKVVNAWLDAVDCPECFDVVLDSLRNGDPDLLKDLARLIGQVERELCVMSEIPANLGGREFRVFYNRIQNGLLSVNGFKRCSHLFVSAEFGSPCHFTNLVKDIVEIYLRMRIMYLSREVKIGINDFQDSSMKFSLGHFWA